MSVCVSQRSVWSRSVFVLTFCICSSGRATEPNAHLRRHLGAHIQRFRMRVVVIRSANRNEKKIVHWIRVVRAYAFFFSSFAGSVVVDHMKDTHFSYEYINFIPARGDRGWVFIVNWIWTLRYFTHDNYHRSYGCLMRIFCLSLRCTCCVRLFISHSADTVCFAASQFHVAARHPPGFVQWTFAANNEEKREKHTYICLSIHSWAVLIPFIIFSLKLLYFWYTFFFFCFINFTLWFLFGGVAFHFILSSFIQLHQISSAIQTTSLPNSVHKRNKYMMNKYDSVHLVWNRHCISTLHKMLNGMNVVAMVANLPV